MKYTQVEERHTIYQTVIDLLVWPATIHYNEEMLRIYMQSRQTLTVVLMGCLKLLENYQKTRAIEF